MGSLARWLRHDLKILVVLTLPPLAVITVYACLTSKPFEGMLMGDWLVKSIAQEVLFAGFIYARLADVFGVPGEGTRDAFAWPMIITPLLFLLWHWPNANWMQYSYFAFQCVYVFIGGWWSLNLRRWTGSIWPGAALHVLVNYLAAAL